MTDSQAPVRRVNDVTAEPESWIERAARLHPARIAVEAPDATLTYAELEQLAWLSADEIAGRGLEPGDRVALIGLSGARFVAALHGCLRLGVVAVPIDPRLPEREREVRVEQCHTRFTADARHLSCRRR